MWGLLHIQYVNLKVLSNDKSAEQDKPSTPGSNQYNTVRVPLKTKLMAYLNVLCIDSLILWVTIPTWAMPLIQARSFTRSQS